MFLFKGGKILLRRVLAMHKNDRSPKSAENSIPGLPPLPGGNLRRSVQTESNRISLWGEYKPWFEAEIVGRAKSRKNAPC
jgi:hypothetical protein